MARSLRDIIKNEKPEVVAEARKKAQDIKLSTLKGYVESLGGKVNLDVELPDGTHFGFSL